MADKEFPEELLRERDEQLADDLAESIHNRIQSLSVGEKIKLATYGNKEARRLLIKDLNSVVNEAVLNNPKLTDEEAISFAGNRNLSKDVPRIIATKKELVKNYAVKVALVKNVKTPLHVALKLLPFLRERDLKSVADSKNVQRVVADNARKIFSRKRGAG